MASATINAAYWTLSAAGSKAAAESMLTADSGSSESVFDPDKRKKIDSTEFGPTGKYRAIIKLQMKYENQEADDDRWAMGTGWLIRPDLLVTAGHCVYDHKNGFGRVTQVKAYMGYSGKASIGTATVQYRSGSVVVTTEEWVQSRLNRRNDVSFIQLDKKFDGLKPEQLIAYKPTPLTGSMMLAVVGYPGDMMEGTERGAYMYGEAAKVDFKLDGNLEHMLQYRISTFAGQSGSPVMLGAIGASGQLVSIAAHVYGGDSNMGSPISGTYGNPYNTLVAVFDGNYPTVKKVKGVTYLKVTKPKDSSESSLDEGEEGFLDVLKDIAKVALPIGNTVLSVGAPLLLGSAGAPIAALGNVALQAAGRALNGGGAESSFGDETDQAQAASNRAVLAEACLGTLLQQDQAFIDQYQLDKKIMQHYTTHIGTVRKVAPRLLTSIMEPALQVVMENTVKNSTSSSSAAPKPGKKLDLTVPKPSAQQAGQESALSDPDAEQFMKGLLVPTAVLSGEEGFFDSLGSMISTGIRVGGPIVRTAAQGLDLLGGLMGSGQSEAGFDGDSNDGLPGTANTRQLYDRLAKRATFAEATLQALMTVPVDRLADRSAGVQQESIFDGIKTVAQTIGRQVVLMAPSVARTATRIAKGIVAATADDSAGVGGGRAAGQREAGGSKLAPKRSLLDLVSGDADAVPGEPLANGTADGDHVRTLPLAAAKPQPRLIDPVA